MAEQTDIVRATERFREKAVDYDKAERYYKGDHDLAYATVKFQNAFGSLFKTFAMNLCPAICDAVRDKLVITEFGVEKGGKVDAAKEAWKIWTANRMPLRAGEVQVAQRRRHPTASTAPCDAAFLRVSARSCDGRDRIFWRKHCPRHVLHWR